MTRSIDELLQRVADGDEGAFRTLYDLFAPRLLGLIVKIMGRRQDSEDVLQEVFEEIWRHADRYDPGRGSPEFWLLMLTRSRTIDFLRRRRTPALDVTVEDRVIPDLSAARERGEFAARACQALHRLPSEQQEVIALAFFRGRTGQQIADLTGIPHGTVKTRIRLGMLKLREYLNVHHEVSNQ